LRPGARADEPCQASRCRSALGLLALAIAGLLPASAASTRLVSAGTKPWDLAIAEITITPERKRTIAFSRPYMSVDQGVLVVQSLRSVPKTIAALGALRICALRKSTGAVVAQEAIAPKTPVLLVGNVPSALPKGSALLGRVNDAIAALIADGTVARLQSKWLTAHLENLTVLR
jgi:ABC-type amino acid transport substrate-binding protein